MSEVPALAVVLTPVASAPALAGLCAMSGIDVHVVPSSAGAVAVIELGGADAPAADEATADAIVGATADVPGGVTADEPAPEGESGDAGGPDDLPVGDWDISELLGGGQDEVPAEADELARTLSRLSKAGVVLVTGALTRGGIESGLSGQLTARRYAGGEAGEDVAVGLVLAGADDVVEELVLGRTRVVDVPGHQRSGDLPRWKAARMFAKGLRRRQP